MVRPIHGLLLQLIASMGLFVCTAPAQAGEIDNIKEAWKKRTLATKTIRFTWTHRRIVPKGLFTFFNTLTQRTTESVALPPDDYTATFESSLSLDNKALRFESAIPFWNPGTNKADLRRRVVTVNSSQQSKSFMPAPAGTSIPDQGRIGAARTELNPEEHEVSPLLATCRGLDSSMQPFDLAKYSVENQKQIIDGTACLLLVKGRFGANMRHCLWLDPSRDYVLKKVLLEQGGRTRYSIDVQYQRHATGVWLPSTWKIVVRIDGKQLIETSTCDVTKIDLDPEIPPSSFDQTFPSNSMLYDGTKGKWINKPTSRSATPSAVYPSLNTIICIGLIFGNILLSIACLLKWRLRTRNN